MNLEPHLMFATPVWIIQFEDFRMMHKKLMLDTVEYSALGDWNLFDIDKEGVNEFKQKVSSIGNKIAKDYDIPFNSMEMRGRQHVRRPFENDPPHHHPYADGIVGVYYLQALENCGDLLIHDARGSLSDIWQDPYVKKTKEPHRKNHSGLMVHRVKPEPGKFVLFPSYAIHSVETNLSNDLRISLIVEFKYSL